ncbi:hypothetical protein J7K50_02160, partial [bacterium]|nr:hypothetical protein [bacterium]
MLKLKRSEAFRRIVADPDYWRETMRECEELAWPQRYIRDVLLGAIDNNLENHEGGIYVVMAARQTTKNESEAELEA